MAAEARRRSRRSWRPRPIARLEAAYPDVPVYRFIPNIPVEVGRGVFCYAPGTLAAEGPEQEVLALFGRAGVVIRAGRAVDRARRWRS